MIIINYFLGLFLEIFKLHVIYFSFDNYEHIILKCMHLINKFFYYNFFSTFGHFVIWLNMVLKSNHMLIL